MYGDPLHQHRALTVDGLVNCRDLGGLPRRDGSTTPRGVFFRSESIDRVTPDGWDQLYAAGVRTVVDLRQGAERDQDSQPRPDWLTTVHVDHDGLDNQDFWKDYWDNGLMGTALYYLPHLATMPERTGAALTAVVNAPDGGVLFHCAGGRDRTGLIAALLLLAVDVEPEAIVSDYLETIRLGDVRAAALAGANDEQEMEDLCGRHGTTTEGAFRAALGGIDLTELLDVTALDEKSRTSLFGWRGSLDSTV